MLFYFFQEEVETKSGVSPLGPDESASPWAERIRERLEYAISLQLKPSTTFSMPETTTHSSAKSWCQMRFDDGIGFGQSVMELPQVPQRWKLFADPFHRWH